MLDDSTNVIRMAGKYYMLEEVGELTELCRAHQVLLTLGIGIPGHSTALIRTFHRDMQNPEGMETLELLLDEICETFDVPHLYIGTDEVHFTSPQLVSEMMAYVCDKGRKVTSWNPGWKYKANEIDMMQPWSYRGKAQQGIPAIDSRFHYLNHFDTFGDIITLYNNRTYNADMGGDDLAGIIVGIWNDRLTDKEQNMVLENSFYPDMLVIAKRSWRGGGTEYFDKQGAILSVDENSEVFRSFENFESRILWYKEHLFRGYLSAHIKQTHVKRNTTDVFPNERDLTKVFPPEEELKDSYTYEGRQYEARPAIGAGIYLRHVWGKIAPAFCRSPQENHTAYTCMYVYPSKTQEIGL